MFSNKIQLPSRGKYGKTHVSIKSPTVDDLRSYLSSQGNHIVAIKNFVKELCDTDLSNYPVGDLIYVFLTLRTMVNPTPLEGEFICDEHEKPVSSPYLKEIKDIKIDQLPDDFEYPSVVPLKVLNRTIKMTVLTSDGEEKVSEYLELHKTSDRPMKNSDLGDDLETFARYACMIVNDESIDHNISFVRSLDLVDFEVIVLYDLLFQCGPLLFVDSVCVECKKVWRVNIKIDQNFLGISLKSLLTKHRFLNKVSNIGFKDFLAYTAGEMEGIVQTELANKQNSGTKKQPIK